MAQSTVELRNLLNTDFELFDFDYDFDDKSFKQEIEQAVIDYYYFYEIGQETPDRFKHTFKRRFLSMIDYYNKLHNTTLLEYNPLTNYTMNELQEQLRNSEEGQTNTQNINSDATLSGTVEQTGDENEKMSDYPQQSIAGGDYLEGERQTNTNQNETSNQTTNNITEQTGNLTRTNTENSNYQKTIEGLTGITYQELIQKERDNLIRIKSMIIEELKPCFILVH